MRNFNNFLYDFRKREDGLIMRAKRTGNFKLLMNYTDTMGVWERQFKFKKTDSHGDIRRRQNDFMALAENTLRHFKIALITNNQDYFF